MVSTRKPEAIYHGNDWCWSIDGHDKLRNFGIEIYGAVDAHSRRILWFYVGILNRTQISVTKQYLEAVKTYGKRPKFIRSDRGRETVIWADAHYSLYMSEQIALGLPDAEADQLPLRECYMYGRSTSNQRIESLWNGLIMRQTKP